MGSVDLLTADDPDYVAQFDVAKEAAEVGNAIDVDLPAALKALREKGPVHRGEPRELLDLPAYAPFAIDREAYSVMSYASCAAALRDNHLFSSQAYMDYSSFRALGDSIISMVGDEHKNLRAASQPMFVVPRARDWWKPNWIGEISTALLNRLEGMDKADLNIELCARLPIHTIIRGIGIDSQKALRFRENMLLSLGMRIGTPEDRARSGVVVTEMLQDVIAERRLQRKQDVVSNLLNAQVIGEDGEERGLNDEEVRTYAQLIIIAGSATTWRQLGMAIHALMTHYHFWEACRDDRSLVPQAVEEAARWSPTQQIFPRLTTADAELEGHVIPAWSRVFLCMGSANRDPARWERADEFDIFREKKAHLGFGMGAHICLGMHVAKEEMVTALNGLMDRFPNMRPDPAYPPGKVIGALEQRGMNHVGVLLR